MSPDLHSAAAPANTQIKLMIVAINASISRLTSFERPAPNETTTLIVTVIRSCKLPKLPNHRPCGTSIPTSSFHDIYFSRNGLLVADSRRAPKVWLRSAMD